ncbi:AraC family transcriptional regulator [Marinobacter xestospongiae]|uniref:AraC family transcriptional regulator n=1 Tax=Marinobacter xestospongiae TaxID=994319 RepID=A0ABU3VSI5_9GAMM|nr:AraC family transcriptional regulator [Marinobacter xestospongiae]MDV2077161.1 AraC family transcriptional regulator [Marinobacter xestospongiae]
MTSLPYSPQSSRAHIANHYLRASISGALAQGDSASDLLAQAHIPEHWLDQPGHPVTERQLSDLIKAVWRSTGDEFMGLAANRCKRGAFSLMAELAQGASTLGGMLHQSARFYSAIGDDLDIGQDDPGTGSQLFYRLHLRHRGEDRHHFLQEFILLMWQRFASWLVGQQIPIAGTRLAYPAPPHAVEYHSMYPGELSFDQPRCGFVLHRRCLQLPIVRTGAELQAFLADCPAVILHRPHRDNRLHTRLQALLQRYDFEHLPSLESLSDQLLMAPRTLRRRLREEGTSLRQIKEALRRDFAQKLLANEHLSVQDIALQTGFTEAAAFCRAFKRWTGQSPARWRQGARTVGIG